MGEAGLFCSSKECCNFIPVDDSPESTDVIRAAILVIEVIGVLPDIESKDGGGTTASCSGAHEWIVLIWCGGDGEGFVCFDHEPCPARAETCGACLGKSFLEGIKRSKGSIDGCSEIARWRGGTAWSDDLPEVTVIDVATSVVADGTADVFWHGCKVGDQIHSGFVFDTCFASDGVVEVGDVGLVMLAMVDFHGASIDVWFESVVVVTEGG